MAAVLIKDEKMEEFLQEARIRGWLLEEDDDLPPDYVIPQWQIDETLRRQAANKPEDYIPWTEVRATLKERYGRKDV